MKITHIITSLDRGGAETCLYNLIKNSDSKFNFQIICLGSIGVFSNKFKNLSIQVEHLNMKKNFFSFITSFFKIIKMLKATQPDVVQTWMYHSDLLGGLSAKICKVKKIYWTIVTSNLNINFIGRQTFFVAKICSILSKLIPNKIITVAKSAIKVHTNISYDKKKFIHIPIGFEINYSKINNKKEKKYLKNIFTKLKLENKFIIGSVARWHSYKNQILLLKSLSILKDKDVDFFCFLVGTDINYNNKILLNEMKQLNLDKKNILLIEQLDDINYFMKEIDLFVLTSLGEGMPNVIGEAMLNETPCISSDVGDCAYLIDDTGWIFESNNLEQLTDTLIKANKFKKNELLWNDIKKRCSNRINKSFSYKKMKDSYEFLWTK